MGNPLDGQSHGKFTIANQVMHALQAFLHPLPVSRLWGVGKVSGKTFSKLGIRTIAELRQLPVEILVDHFGQSGTHLWQFLRAWLLDLTEQVATRLRHHKLAGRTVQLKIRFADFHTITRAQTLSEPTSTTHDIWQAAREILDTRLPARHLPVRLLGVGVS